jgi:hypothetical protein
MENAVVVETSITPRRARVNFDCQTELMIETFRRQRELMKQRRALRSLHWSTNRQSFKHNKSTPRPEPREFDSKGKTDEEVQEVCNESVEFLKYWNMDESRRARQKYELRAMHLAYGFLNGLPYSKIETDSNSPASFFEERDTYRADTKQKIHHNGFLKTILKYARRFSEWGQPELMQKFAEWEDGLREHIKKINAQKEEKRKSRQPVKVTTV